jgi:hypothetical protein
VSKISYVLYFYVKVPIDEELIKAVQLSYSCYKEELAIAKVAAEQMEKKEKNDKMLMKCTNKC